MCGIAGIVSDKSVNQDLFDSLNILQHRGQDAAGIVTSQDDGMLHMRKSNGLARDVFGQKHMQQLTGSMGIAHCRYPTAGCSSSAEAQPFYVNSPFGISLGHNGNLINADELRHELKEKNHRHLNTTSDSEILINVLAHELQQIQKVRLNPSDIFSAVSVLHERASGGYAVIAIIAGYGVLAFRDPHGIRPLVFGTRKDEDGNTEYMVASESVALESLGFDLVRDVAPGEALFIDKQHQLFTQQCAKDPVLAPCLFEYVYLARPDSIIDDVSVYEARLKMGEKLGQKISAEWENYQAEIDVVMPIPDSGRISARQLANTLGLEYQEGFIKNRYIGRTFIMPGQRIRKKSVRQKLNAIRHEFAGKNVMLVDDSIVRGNTSKEIVQMAREVGAKKVYIVSAAPPVIHPNVYGIDMPTHDELISHNRDAEEVAQATGADRVIFQDLADLRSVITELNPKITQYEDSCFSGEYITGDVGDEYFATLEQSRSDAAKNKTNGDTAGNDSQLDLHET